MSQMTSGVPEYDVASYPVVAGADLSSLPNSKSTPKRMGVQMIELLKNRLTGKAREGEGVEVSRVITTQRCSAVPQVTGRDAFAKPLFADFRRQPYFPRKRNFRQASGA